MMHVTITPIAPAPTIEIIKAAGPGFSVKPPEEPTLRVVAVAGPPGPPLSFSSTQW